MVVLEDGCCGTRARLSSALDVVGTVRRPALSNSRATRCCRRATSQFTCTPRRDWVRITLVSETLTISQRCANGSSTKSNLSTRTICMILWSINTMRPSEDGVHLYDEFLDALSSAALRSVYAFAPHELAPTMHALASLPLTNPKLICSRASAFEMTWPPTGRSLSKYDTHAMVLRRARVRHRRARVTRGDARLSQSRARREIPLETKTILQSLARLGSVFSDDEHDVDSTRAGINAAIERHIDDYTQSDCEVPAWSLFKCPRRERAIARARGRRIDSQRYRRRRISSPQTLRFLAL